MNLKKNIFIILKLTILLLLCFLTIIGIIYLLKFNFNIADYISYISGIPRDMAISIASFGFVNNIVILMSVIETVLCIYISYKIVNTSTYKNIKNFMLNL